MDIPITITFKGNIAELDRDLLGLSEKINEKSSEYIPKDEPPLHDINTESSLVDGVIIKPKLQPKRTHKIEESIESNIVDYHYILSLMDIGLGIGMNAYTIADKFLQRIMNHTFKIAIDGKEVKTKDEFQKTLDEYIKTHS